MNNKNKALFFLLIVSPLAAIFMAGVKVYYDISIWKYEGESIVFEVKRGEGFSSINGRLKNGQLISSAKIFHRYAQIHDYMTKFKAGKFKIETGSNMLDVFEELLNGKAIADTTTIPEGKNLYQVADILHEKKIIKNKRTFIQLAKSRSFAQEIGIKGDTLEGYLYPDTYHFEPDSDPRKILKAMISNFKNKMKTLDFNNSSLSFHEVIILASVVEKETGVKEERPRIAGVFHNRLKKRMRLQSDPTTIYGIWENFNGNLRKKHLLEKTPYNTYKIPGLPKGPISNPGLLAVKAVLMPEEHDYLYFVSQNDGTHVFSKNYKDHVKAVNYFQKNSANRKGKSWRDLNKN